MIKTEEIIMIVLVIILFLLILFPLRIGWEADAVCRSYGYSKSAIYGLPADYEHTYCLMVTEKNLSELMQEGRK